VLELLLQRDDLVRYSTRATPTAQTSATPLRAQYCSYHRRPFVHADNFTVGNLNMLDTSRPISLSVISEKDLRHQIDRSVSRALVDSDYARLLLSNPTVVLEDRGCPPQQYRWLSSIDANTLPDFARQAQALFWAAEPARPALQQEDRVPMAAAAAR